MIRAATPDEFEAIGELIVETYRDVGETDEAYVPELRDVAGRAARVPVLAAVDEATGRVLGTVTYVPGPGPYHEGEFGDAAQFRMLAVAAEARGRGIGKALVGACVDRARAAGRASIGLYTRPFMTDAQRMYERLGFHRVAELDLEYELGEWLFAYRLGLT